MGSILLDNVQVGDECVIGAGALLPQRMVVPPRSLVLGMPAKVVRKVTDEELRMGIHGARVYQELARKYR
jgi:carbonic anhydrase/acetyltransferase-like protein (isoleucine patch superfamily)